MSSPSKPLIIRDELHGDISFDPVLRAAIDHPNFQRLRHIQQLGLAYYVFPCASHTRFQHSLGCSYLAGKYLEQLIQGWEVSPFDFNGVVGSTEFLSRQTRLCLSSVAGDPKSYEFWSRVVRLAGLLHDVGHGPWSHTFETLKVGQDFRRPVSLLEPVSRSYLKSLIDNNERFRHEDITLLYVHEILHQMERDGSIENASLFYLAVASLIHKKLLYGEQASELEGVLIRQLKQAGMRGGIEIHRLVRPVISGPFDVDRIDYIQRDGRNCGVYIGGIEWGRILGQVMPCLANHPNDSEEPSTVVLISSTKNQHILDDFTFSLYQMYAQVYLHPKIVGLEETIRRELTRAKLDDKSFGVTLDIHRGLSDEKFSDLLTDKLGAKLVRKLLMREREAAFDVKSFLSDSGIESDLKALGYHRVEDLDRPFMKDRMGVFLFNVLSGTSGSQKAKCFINRWLDASPIAREFHSMSYSPRIWVRKRGRNQE